MKLEQQVCSLELAKRLKTLGVKQEGIFQWFKPHEQTPFVGLRDGVKEVWDDDSSRPVEVASAFTVAELLNMLQELRKTDILIPVNIKVADYLATELVKDYEKSESSG